MFRNFYFFLFLKKLLVFDSSTQQALKSTDINNLQSIDSKLSRFYFASIPSLPFFLDNLAFPTTNDCSTKLLTLLRSINLEKYWSTFERNEVIIH